MASAILTGTFGSAAAGAEIIIDGDFNISLWGTFVATVLVEKSYDGSTWIGVSRDAAGTAASYTAPASVVLREPETNVRYRLRCGAYTSGTVNWRISQ